MLNEQRIAGIAEGLKKLIALPCPRGGSHRTAHGGVRIVIERVRVPFGVIGIVYESRPNVTGGRHRALHQERQTPSSFAAARTPPALHNIAIVTSIKEALKAGGFDPSFIQLITDKTREGAREFMRQKGLIDVLIPRGSKTLIDSALENATVPVIETGTGNCHIYLEQSADINKAIPILINAKTQRTSVCNAAESLVVDRSFAEAHMKEICDALTAKQVELGGGCRGVRARRRIAPADGGGLLYGVQRPQNVRQDRFGH